MKAEKSSLTFQGWDCNEIVCSTIKCYCEQHLICQNLLFLPGADNQQAMDLYGEYFRLISNTTRALWSVNGTFKKKLS